MTQVSIFRDNIFRDNLDFVLLYSLCEL